MNLPDSPNGGRDNYISIKLAIITGGNISQSRKIRGLEELAAAIMGKESWGLQRGQLAEPVYEEILELDSRHLIAKDALEDRYHQGFMG